MKKTICLTILSLAILFVFAGLANALEKTSTGFYYPIGESDFDQRYGRWLNGDSSHKTSDQTCLYYDGKYHIGVDMMTNTFNPDNENSHVYSIANGKIVNIHQSSDWGITNTVNNCMVFIQYKTKDGTNFIGYYGHIQLADGIGSGKEVCAGQYIGYTGDYKNGIHLHFGIREGTSTSPSPWGMMPASSWPDTNGFTNPIAFIKNNSPETTLKYRLVGNVAWYPANVSCVNAQRWIYYNRNYPNGGMSLGSCDICYQKETEMMEALGGYGSNWWNIIFGNYSLDEIEICK